MVPPRTRRGQGCPRWELIGATDEMQRTVTLPLTRRSSSSPEFLLTKWRKWRSFISLEYLWLRKMLEAVIKHKKNFVELKKNLTLRKILFQKCANVEGQLWPLLFFFVFNKNVQFVMLFDSLLGGGTLFFFFPFHHRNAFGLNQWNVTVHIYALCWAVIQRSH